MGNSGIEYTILDASSYKPVKTEHLHEGGFGTVWLAKDEHGDKVVIKFPKTHHIVKDPETLKPKSQLREHYEAYIQGLTREIQLLEPMKGDPDAPPSLIKFRDKSVDKHKPFLVVEYLEGETIYETVRHYDLGRLPEEKAVEYGIQIAEGLDYLHRNGIYHRDIKPPNVMVTKRGCVLIDLGVGKQLKESDKQAMMQTKGPPKSELSKKGRDPDWDCQHVGQRNWYVTEQCDLYSVGRLLFFMLTGRSKISALVDKETHKMKKTVRDLVPNLSERINQLVTDLLDPRHQENPDYFIAKSESPNQRGLVNELELIPSSSATTDISGSVTRPIVTPGAVPWKKLHKYVPQPHIIVNGARHDIENGLCELGREHDICPRPQSPNQFDTPGIPNVDCYRGLIHQSVDGFPYPLKPSVPIPSSDKRAEYHHLRIWEDKQGKYWAKDLQTRSWSGRIVNQRWEKMEPMKKIGPLNNIERFAIGFSHEAGPEIQVSFYKE